MIKIRNKDNFNIVSKKDMSSMLIALSFITLISIAFIEFKIHTVYAEQNDIINKTKIVLAPIDKVWSIVSDIDKNSNYWPIKDIKDIKKTSNNTIERDVTVPAPPFMNSNAHQIITLYPEKSTVIENQTQGPITGIKTIRLSSIDSNNNNSFNKTSINVLWTLDLSKIPTIGKGFAKDNINKSVDDALSKIENAI
jgi:carbon monoxide dehydrogenase subunit G